MASKIEITPTAELQHSDDQLPAAAFAQTSIVRRGASSLRRTWQRGMATAEYAVGILAAVALALVLLGIFNKSEFLDAMLKLVLDLIAKVGTMIG